MACELLFRDDAYLRACAARVTAVSEHGIELDRTVFYPRGGGQPGDTGELRRADGVTVRVIDTPRHGQEPDAVVHLPEPDAPTLTVGDTVTAELDWKRRYAHMRIHTALHVLSCVVVAPVTGGNIAADKGRLDFDIDMSLLNAERIEREANTLIERAVATETVWITDAELVLHPSWVDCK